MPDTSGNLLLDSLPAAARRPCLEAGENVSFGLGEEIITQGDRAKHLHGEIRAALAEGMSEYQRPNGEVWGPASTWIVSATAPA